MARQRISLVPDEVKEVKQIRSLIETGKITEENFDTLTPLQQAEVRKVLFQMAEGQISLTQGVSAVEFVLFAFIRIMNKRVKGLALSAEDQKIEADLNKVLDLHQISNENLSKDEWLFDYMEYAYAAASGILKNREEHINRKKNVTGEI